MSGTRYSIMEYFGRDVEGHRCGYCDGATGSISHGMWAHLMSVGDYQSLIDRGWRRSGKYCYKPIMEQTCCPQYTIRLDVNKFSASKSQRKLARKFRNFIINGGKTAANEAGDKDETDDKLESVVNGPSDLARMEMAEAKSTADFESNIRDNEQKNNHMTSKVKESRSTEERASDSPKRSNVPVEKSPAKVKQGVGADPDKPRAKKAKDLRRERAAAKGKTFSKTPQNRSEQRSMVDILFEPYPENCAHKLEIRCLPSHTDYPEFEAVFDEEFEVYKKYQVSIHRDPPEKVTKSQFKRFLCNSSLFQEGDEEDEDASRGAFHMQYRLDGRLIMVGVIDVLTSCISSKYLFYDPAFAHLSPGNISALYEIAITQRKAKRDSELHYYYMGFYIHSCDKMRYKARYKPSDLLCPITYEWVTMDRCTPLLDANKFTKLGSEATWATCVGNETVTASEDDVGKALVLYQRSVMPFSVFCARVESSRDKSELEDQGREVSEYARLVGGRLAGDMLLYRT